MLITNNFNFFKKVKKLKAFGIDKDINNRKKQGTYNVTMLGYNYRMTDFQAAMGYSQIITYSKALKRRKEIAKKYFQYLSSIKNVDLMPNYNGTSYFIFQIFLKNNLRDKLLREFKKLNIGCSIHYATPIPFLKYYKQKNVFENKEFSNTLKYAKTNISLPVSENLTNEEINYICKKIKILVA